MEAAVRTAYMLVAGEELEGGPKVAEARGAEGVRRFTVTAGDARLNLAVVNGLGRVKESVDGLLDPEAGMHFVEVMSCPGGCIGGGGQPYATDTQAVKERLERLYEVDRRSRTRRSHENADVTGAVRGAARPSAGRGQPPAPAPRATPTAARKARRSEVGHERSDHHHHQAELPPVLHVRA